MMKRTLLFLALIYSVSDCLAQGLTQTVRGVVVDKQTQVPLIGATVILVNSQPPRGVTTDVDGNFVFEKVPVGRQSFTCSYVGYNSSTISDVFVNSGKELVLTFSLEEKINNLAEVVVSAYKKDEALNKMATVSARTLSVEEAGRYAGGNDDPARLAASFAGVASGMSNNGIVIRGNAPKGLLWRLEDIEIDNPNHFANIQAFGGGGMTALSSHMLANSDFFTGAFPAEYGNALSGVFDLKMRTGNNQKHEHAIQVGSLGIDIASEGPIVKGKKASYLFNYRYSTLALLTPILPPEAGRISYQDFSFKLNFPCQKNGTIAFWGLGSTDKQIHDANTDSTKWKSNADLLDYKTQASMGASGITYKKRIGNKTNISAIAAVSGSSMLWNEKKLDSLLVLRSTSDVTNNNWRLIGTLTANRKINEKLSVKAGFIFTRLFYKEIIEKLPKDGDVLQNYVDKSGSADKIQAFSQAKYSCTDALSFNVGIHTQYYKLIDHLSVEPRFGFRWNFMPYNTLSFAYGLHSQSEPLCYYMTEISSGTKIVRPNIGLDFTKAHHFVIGYERQLGEHTRLKLEPYIQYLFSVPVIPNSYYSLQNVEADWFFADSLINKGSGRNMGIDITLEQFLNKGLYYLATVSLFDSHYKGGDNILRETRFNKQYVVNLLAGKEWSVGTENRNSFSFNARLSLLGGDRTIPVLMQQSVQQTDVIYDYANAFSTKKPDAQILSFSINYRINKEKHTSLWSLHVINVLMQKEFEGYEYNSVTRKVEKQEDPFFIPYISYKLEF